jgi:hypothetical protein
MKNALFIRLAKEVGHISTYADQITAQSLLPVIILFGTDQNSQPVITKIPLGNDKRIYAGLNWLKDNLTDLEWSQLMVLRLEGAWSETKQESKPWEDYFTIYPEGWVGWTYNKFYIQPKITNIPTVCSNITSRFDSTYTYYGNNTTFGGYGFVGEVHA